MAGHSHASNVMVRKGAQDRLKSKIFSKLAREITVAVKAGGNSDPAVNNRLRQAVLAARKENMPKDNIDRAIKKGLPGGDDAVYEDVRYEGYGPSNVAIIVEGLTDNRHRTGSAIKAVFSKAGGALGEPGSVAFNFTRSGVITYKYDAAMADTMFEAAVNAGADDMISDNEVFEILCAFEDLAKVREALEAKFGAAEAADIQWRPNLNVEIKDAESARKFFNFIEALQENDDVQKVFANHEIAAAILAEVE